MNLPSSDAPTTFSVNARDFGTSADGQTDDTAALQRALDTCAQAGAGMVHLPTGQYAVRGSLVVPEYVTLQGVHSGPAVRAETNGSTLLAYDGRGKEDGPPFITLKSGAALNGLCVHYPEQTGDPITPYPWCVAGDGHDVSVINCLLNNPYQGINLGTAACPRHFISRVCGYPLRRGIFVDQCFDIGRIENVHLWPYWRAGQHRKKVYDFVQANGEAFIFAMTDWQYVFNTFCWGYKVGYRFTENGRGVCNGNLLGIGVDACNASILVDNCAAYGVLITNGEFVAIYGDKPTPIVVQPTNSGVIQFNNCSFWGPCHQCARIGGKGYVSFQQCHFMEWNPERDGVPGIEVSGGSVNIGACRFAKAAEAVRIGRDVRGAVVTGNLFAQQAAVQVESGGHATVEANATEAPPGATIPGSTVISALGPQVVIEGDWWDYAGRGTYTGVAYFAVQRDRIARFRWNLGAEQPGAYTLSAWIPNWVAPVSGDGRATYHIHHAKGDDTLEVVQSEHPEAWTPLGVFHINRESYVVIENTLGNTALADCLLVTKTTGPQTE